MRIRDLGEFGLIDRIKKNIKLDASVIKGTGDDCAVIEFNRHSYQLLTCDMIIEGVDFKHGEDPYLVGRKALAVSLSDIAACAGLPRYALVSLGLPEAASVKTADEICRGILELAAEFKVNLVGGDVSRAKQLTLDVSISGVVEKRQLVLRNGALPGDVIFATGSFGESILGKHLRFIPRIKEARFLVKNFKVNSMIDVSDGLAQDLGHILDESGVGAEIHEDLIPRYRKSTTLEEALYDGEDFELLFTLEANQAKKLLAKKSGIFSPIGRITGEKHKLRLVDRKCREKIIKPKGYKHF
ncbi:MAG: thiamine-phosphate kinase [Deltaproteobacteria bacterium]